MSANTRQDKPFVADERLLAFTKLSLTAAQLIQQGARSEESFKALMRVLQLFKENRLFLEGSDHVSKQLIMAEINCHGEVSVLETLLEDLPPRVAAACSRGFSHMFGRRDWRSNPHALREIVHFSPRQLVKCRGVGPETISQLERALSRKGLRLGMSEKAIEETFGPIEK